MNKEIEDNFRITNNYIISESRQVMAYFTFLVGFMLGCIVILLGLPIQVAYTILFFFMLASLCVYYDSYKAKKRINDRYIFSGVKRCY